MNFIHLNYHCHTHIKDPAAVISLHALSSGFINHLPDNIIFHSVKHMDHEGELRKNGQQFHFFRKGNRTWSIPFRTHKKIGALQPDIILVEGLVFPLQLICLRQQLRTKCRIMVQHHGERPWKGAKRWLQQLADHVIDAYLFSSIDNAIPWVEKGIISSKQKCFEVLSASTEMRGFDRQALKEQHHYSGVFNFLWVGRFISVKDPLTVLKGFRDFARSQRSAMLRMVYQDDTLLDEVRQFIRSEGLENQVALLGKKSSPELEELYSAADYYISGSHREGSGYALVEAMSCGCIPVVTDIPSFRMITAGGKRGYLFAPGDHEALSHLLHQLSPDKTIAYSRLARQHATVKLSASAIAERLLEVSSDLLAE